MKELKAFVMAHAATAPLGKRARLYRALADYCGDEAESGRLLGMAIELEHFEEKHRALEFSFVQAMVQGRVA